VATTGIQNHTSKEESYTVGLFLGTVMKQFHFPSTQTNCEYHS